MSEPTPDPEASSSDPLFNDPGLNEWGAATHTENPDFAPGDVIAAEPISMYIPEEGSSEATPRSAVRRRNPDEMSKRPSWLPEGWTIDLKVRSSGATAGLIDRYYVEPTGQRKFRSKIEVLHFLETGSSKPKRKLTPDAEPNGSPASQKQRKSKKSDTTHVRNGVPASNVR